MAIQLNFQWYIAQSINTDVVEYIYQPSLSPYIRHAIYAKHQTYIVSVKNKILIQETPMSKNISASEVSGECMLGIFRPSTERSNILTPIIRLWGLPWKQAILLQKTTTYEGPPIFLRSKYIYFTKNHIEV